jgi:hypothetical protein
LKIGKRSHFKHYIIKLHSFPYKYSLDLFAIFHLIKQNLLSTILFLKRSSLTMASLTNTFASLALLSILLCTSNGQLSPDYYFHSCPELFTTVKGVVASAVATRHELVPPCCDSSFTTVLLMYI